MPATNPKSAREDDPLKDFITVQDVAAKLGLNVQTIYERVRLGVLHPVKARRLDPKKGKRFKRLLFDPTEVDSELARLETIRLARIGSATMNRPPKEEPLPPPKPVPIKESKTDPSKPTLPELEVDTAQPEKEDQERKQDKRITPARNGELCAQAVRLFREGKTQLDIVVEMEVNFEVARYYEECYHYAQPGWFLPKKDFAHLRQLLGWGETPPTPEGFMKAVRDFIDKEVARIVGERSAQGDDLTDEERRQLAELEREQKIENEENAA